MKRFIKIVFEKLIKDILIHFILGFILWVFCRLPGIVWFRFWILRSKLIATKEEIANWYGVTRKTFNKWIQYFAQEIDFEQFRKKRKLSFQDLQLIVKQLGNPEVFSSHFKVDLVEKLESYYHTLRENTSAFRMSTSQYKHFDVYPPKLSKQILQCLG